MPFFYPPSGQAAVVSQSGNIQNMLIGGVVMAGFGVSKAASSGNEADLKIHDYFNYYAQDPKIEVVISYIEGISDGREFFESVRTTTKEKPVIILQGGRTQSGISAAASHTGAMAVNGDLFNAACKQAGATVVDTIEDAGIVGASFINRPLPKGRRVGILTGGGGLGVVAADACTKEGLEVAKLSDKTLKEIGKLMPDWWVAGNPVDLVAGLRFDTIKPIIETLMRSGEIDSLMFLFIGPPSIEGTREPRTDKGIDLTKIWDNMTSQFRGYFQELYKLMIELDVPLYPVSNHIIEVDEQNEDLRVALYPDITSACTSLRAMVDYYEYREGMK